MKLSTNVNIPKFNFKLSHKDNIAFLGSCFSDNIGLWLKDYKFNILNNPFGTLYNPISISNSIENIINNKRYKESDLLLNNEKYFCFDFHTLISDIDKNSYLHKINNVLRSANYFFNNLDYIFITLGTSYVYREVKSNNIVANCHKLATKTFTRERLDKFEIFSKLNKIQNTLISANPNLKIVYTVSPIRHFKDGAIENQISKSILILAVSELMKQNKNIFYFPSYEIVNDELRDYRFYSKDLIHLNDIAIEYIREKFADTFFNTETKELNSKLEKLVKAYNHNTSNTNSEEYKKFVQFNLELIKDILNRYPNLNMSKELNKLGLEL